MVFVINLLDLPENLVGLVENLIECGFRGSAQSVVNRVILDYLVEHVDYDCRQFVVNLYNNPTNHNDSEPVSAEYYEFPKWKPGGQR